MHLSFCKKMLGVSKWTSNSLLYYELSRYMYPLHIWRK
jgi:hypothetical protein